MAFTLADAVVYFTADQSKLDQATEQSKGKVSSFVGNATKMIGGALVGASVAAAGALVGIGVAGAQSFISFEQKMNEVFTLLPGISKSGMDKMTGQVKDFAKEFGVLPEDVVPALYQALSAGVPPDNVFDFLATANKAAVGGVASLETAVDGLTSVVNAYGSDVLSVGQASDLMFTAVKLGKTDFNQLSASLFNVIPTASSLGVKFGDVTAALAALTAQGTPTSVATTQMRQLLVELSQDGGKASKVFQEMAGKTFVQFVAEGGNVQDALILMEQAAAQNDKRLSDMFSSVEAGNAALGLTGKGAQTFAANLAEMDKAAGATDAAFKTMDAGIGKSFEKIRAAWSVAILDIGQKLAPAIALIADIAVQQMPKFTGVITGAFDVVSNVINTVTRFINGLFRNEFGETMNFAAGRFDFIRQRVQEIMPYIQTIITNVLGFLQAFWQQWGGTITAIVQNNLQVLLVAFTTVLDVILQVVKLFLQVLTGDWQGAGETLKNIAVTLWDGIKEIFRLQLDSLLTLVGNFNLADAGRAVLDSLWQGMSNRWHVVEDWFRNKLNWIRNQLPFSEPKDSSSPLRGLKKAGNSLMGEIQKGIEESQLGLGNLSLNGLLSGSQSQAATNGPISITIHVGGAGDESMGLVVRNGVLDALRQAGLR